MKFLGFDKVLCLSPHPDDVEYSMAGTIIKYKDTQFDVFCLTQGGTFDPTTNNSRLDECKHFWSGVDNVNLIFSSFNSIGMGEDALISDIEKTVLNNHEAIIVPCEKDNHFFHRKVNSLAGPLARVSKISILEYYTPSAKPEWTPNMVVELNDSTYFDKKMRLERFFSQSDKTYFGDFCLDSFHTDLYYAKKDVKWVEKFKHILTFQ